MTASEKQDAIEMKYHRHCQCFGICEHCGAPMPDVNKSQLAHILAQTKTNIKKYGISVIHHPENLKLVCGLKCNAAVMINTATRPQEADAHAEMIRAIIRQEQEDRR